MRILLTGGTGFIGSYLTDFLNDKGHHCDILTRSPKKYKSQKSELRKFYHSDDTDSLQKLVDSADVIINLAGENLFDQRWNETVKERIVESREKITRMLSKAILRSENPPKVFVSASAVGIYGNRGDEVLTEESEPADDFLAEVCKKWEAASLVATEKTRVVNPRIGIALEKDGGALSKMLLPFKLFAGGPLGNGKQYFPWIHVHDICDAIYFSIENEKMHGAFNLAAPESVTMGEFAKNLGKALHRPSFFSVPEFALKLTVGEASEALTASQRVEPKALLDAGYEFKYSDLSAALEDILK